MTRDAANRISRSDRELLAALGDEARCERDAAELSSFEALTHAESDRSWSAFGSEPEARELFAPWNETARNALVDRALAQLSAADAPAAAPTKSAAFPRSVRRAALACSGVAALAAAALLMVRVGPPALPGYSVSIQAGDQPARSAASVAPQGRRVVHEHSLLELQLRPKVEVTGGVWSALLVRDPTSAELSVVATRAEVADSGAVRWRASARELTGGRLGSVNVFAVVGSGRAPALSELVRRVVAQRADVYAVELPLLVLSE